MPNHRLAPTVLAVLSLAVLAAAPAQEKVLLRTKFQKDTTLKYRSTTNMTMDVMGQTAQNKITVDTTTTVIDQKDGWTTLRVKTDNTKVEGDNADMAGAYGAPQGTSMRMEVSETGATRNITLENADQLDPMARQILSGTMKSDQAAGFMGASFPKDPVGVGDTWAGEIDAGKMFETNEMITSVSGKLPLKFELVGFEDYKGQRHAKIKMTMSGTITMGVGSPAGDLTATMKMEGTITSWIDTATGFLGKSEGQAGVENDFGMGSMTQQMKTVVERIG